MPTTGGESAPTAPMSLYCDLDEHGRPEASLDATKHKADQRAFSSTTPGRPPTDVLLVLKQAALLMLSLAFVSPNVRRKGRPQVGEARLWASP